MRSFLGLALASTLTVLAIAAPARAEYPERPHRPRSTLRTCTGLIHPGSTKRSSAEPTSMKISEAAAPDATLSAIFVVFGIACVLVLPALFLLYFLAQSDMLEHEH